MSLSVITRTKDRPLLLPRVVDSLARQSSRDYEWIIVNDGGAPEPVDAVVKQAQQSGISVTVVHHEQCRGMEAASNTGIEKSSAPYILIHDDDDTLEPAFIARTLRFLVSNPHYLGVVTHSNKIVEQLDNDKITTLSSHILNPLLESIDLPLLALRNQFPPISFVFSSAACREVGGFDESLPVLGDWDFNLRMLLHGDIGLIPEALANHHHRDAVAATSQAYGNTVTTGRELHLAWESRYRNQKLREDLAQGKSGLGHILSQGRQAELLYRDLEKLRVAGDGWNALMKLSQKIGLHRLIKRLSRD